jgi:hypothetical protein
MNDSAFALSYGFALRDMLMTIPCARSRSV